MPPFLGLPPLRQVKPRSYRYWLSRGTNSLLPPPNPSQHPKPHPSTLQPFHTAIYSLYSTLRSLLKINNLCKWASLTLRPQYVHSLRSFRFSNPPPHQNFVFHNSLDYRSEETEREIGLEKFADERERERGDEAIDKGVDWGLRHGNNDRADTYNIYCRVTQFYVHH